MKSKIKTIIVLVICLILSYTPASVLASGDFGGGTIITRNKSDEPYINIIERNQNKITGTGVPGADVYITLPGGSVIKRTVDFKSEWIAESPFRLTAGQRVEVYQLQPKHSPSETVVGIVGPGL